MAPATHAHRVILVALAAFPLLLAGCILPPPVSETQPADGGDASSQTQANQPPVARAGDDQTVGAGEPVVLNGTASTDADGDALSYIWRQVDGSPGVEIEGRFGSIARFTAPAGLTETTTLVFSLTVGDGGASSTDRVEITVRP